MAIISSTSSVVAGIKFQTVDDIPKLSLWLDSSDDSTIKSNPFFDDWCWEFTSPGQYISSPAALSYNFLNGTFTVEAWVNFKTVASQQAIITNYNSTSTGWYIQLYSGVIMVGFSGDGSNITGSVTIQPNLWYHVAVSGSPGSYKLFINGVQDGATYSGSTSLVGGALGIGALVGRAGYVGHAPINGYLSNVRIVNGKCLYPNNFELSLASVPLQAVFESGVTTPLLALQANSLLVNNGDPLLPLTINGAPVAIDPANELVTCWKDKSVQQLSATQSNGLFSPVFGSTFDSINGKRCVKFDGSTDFLILNDSIDLQGTHTHFFVYERKSAYSVSVSLGNNATNSSSREIAFTHLNDNRIYVYGNARYTSSYILSTGIFLGSCTSDSRLFLNKEAKATVGSWGTPTLNNVDVVGKARSTSGYHEGLIGEIVHTRALLPEFERVKVEKALYDKWFNVIGLPSAIISPFIFDNTVSASLSTTVGVWSASPYQFEVQWQLNAGNGVWSDIPSATSSSLVPLLQSSVENYRTKVIATNVNGSSTVSYSNQISLSSFGDQSSATTIYSISSFSLPESELNSVGLNVASLSGEDSFTTGYNLSSFSMPEGELSLPGFRYYTLSGEDSSTSTYSLSSFSSSVSDFFAQFSLSSKTFNLFKLSTYAVSSYAEKDLSTSITNRIKAWAWEVSLPGANSFQVAYTRTNTAVFSAGDAWLNASIQPLDIRLTVVFDDKLYRSNVLLVG